MYFEQKIYDKHANSFVRNLFVFVLRQDKPGIYKDGSFGSMLACRSSNPSSNPREGNLVWQTLDGENCKNKFVEFKIESLFCPNTVSN